MLVYIPFWGDNMNKIVENIDKQMQSTLKHLEQISLGNEFDQQEINGLIDLLKMYLEYSLKYNNISLVTCTFINFINKISTPFASLAEVSTIEIFKQQIKMEIEDAKTEKSQLLQLREQIKYVDKSKNYTSLFLIYTSLLFLVFLQKQRNNTLNQLIEQYKCGLKLINYEPANEFDEEKVYLKVIIKESLSQLKNNHDK